MDKTFHIFLGRNTNHNVTSVPKQLRPTKGPGFRICNTINCFIPFIYYSENLSKVENAYQNESGGQCFAHFSVAAFLVISQLIESLLFNYLMY